MADCRTGFQDSSLCVDTSRPSKLVPFLEKEYPHEAGSDTDLTIPPLAAGVQAAADDEHRPAAEIVRDALEGYLDCRRWLSRERDLQQVRELGMPDNDLPLTSEYRQTMREKIAQGVRSLRAGKGTEGEAHFVKMDAEFEELERQGRK